MSSDDRFADSGPIHMMPEPDIQSGSSPRKMIIDWDNPEHRRCIAACLVKGVYVMENDGWKMKNGKLDQELAPAWWESFHFERHEIVKYPCKCVCCEMGSPNGTQFIYGAVFKYSPLGDGLPRHPSAPSYIVAFRGTMPRDPTFFGDLGHNFKIISNKQHFCSRFINARKMVERLLDSSPKDGCVWLAGHSLGASIALDVGRDMMVERERNLPTFLFNPPHVSLAPALDGMMDEKAKNGLYRFSYVLKHALVETFLKALKKHMEDLFERLSPWVPEIYVHERDIICMGYIDYFAMREHVRERSPDIARSGTMTSYRHAFDFSFGRKKKEQPHFLPSARLWKNTTSHGSAHELRQWWQPELKLSSKQYIWV